MIFYRKIMNKIETVESNWKSGAIGSGKLSIFLCNANIPRSEITAFFQQCSNLYDWVITAVTLNVFIATNARARSRPGHDFSRKAPLFACTLCCKLASIVRKYVRVLYAKIFCVFADFFYKKVVTDWVFFIFYQIEQLL